MSANKNISKKKRNQLRLLETKNSYNYTITFLKKTVNFLSNNISFLRLKT